MMMLRSSFKLVRYSSLSSSLLTRRARTENKNTLMISLLHHRTLTNKPNNKEEEEKKQKQKLPWYEKIPFGLIFTLTFIGLVVGWFYRGNQNSKRQKAFQKTLLDVMALDHEEIQQFRDENRLTPEMYKNLFNRAKKKYQKKEGVNPSKFFLFCALELGGEFEAKRDFNASHLLERLKAALPRIPNSNDLVDLDVLLIALSLAMSCNAQDRLRAVFESYATCTEDSSSCILKSNEGELEKIVSSFQASFQIPIRAQTFEIDQYPFNDYKLADAKIMIQKAAEAVKKDRAKEKIELPIFVDDNNNTLKPQLSFEDFRDLLFSRPLCVWGECSFYKISRPT